MSFSIIAANQITSLLEHSEIVVLDMRDSQAYLKGHIGHALHATDEQIVRVVEGLDSNVPVLVYCYHGIRSRILAAALAGQGLEHVFSLDGGWAAWSAMNQ